MPKRASLEKEAQDLLRATGIATSFFQEFPCLKPEQLDSDYQIIKDMWVNHHEWLKGDYENKLQNLQARPPLNYSYSIKEQKARIAQAHDVQKQWATYDALAKTYAENEAKAKVIRTELDETEYAAKGYPEWLELDKACSNYEFELQVYQNRLLERESWQTKLAEMNAAIEDYTLAIKGLKAAKNEIKNHLLPSLNNAASQLAATMSAGAINSVLMLDDFSIKAMKADRYRPVETFSGSEASIINLALRIALGQVLTHSVFSVLIGDEIDASMDSARTAAVWSALARLVEANKIKQVILVSHESEPIQVQGLNYVHFS
jgi:DNA repair exonuclease SbcCD ATPase subunit